MPFLCMYFVSYGYYKEFRSFPLYIYWCKHPLCVYTHTHTHTHTRMHQRQQMEESHKAAIDSLLARLAKEKAYSQSTQLSSQLAAKDVSTILLFFRF